MNTKFKQLIAMLIFTFGNIGIIFSQTTNIRGKVIDQVSEVGISYATVILQGTTQEVRTDSFGHSNLRI